jgi:Phosphoesterase family
MQGRARWGLLLWPFLFAFFATGGSLVSVSAAAGPASASPRVTDCSVVRHSGLLCCAPKGKTGRLRCFVGLTLGASPNPSTDGQTVVISGRLGGPHHAHAVVLLWRRLPGSRRFRATAGTRTNASGAYSMSVRLDGNRWWYVTARGLRSRTVHQRVQALITLAPSETKAAPGDQVTFSGSVAPSHPGLQVVLQQLGPLGWQQVGQGGLSGASDFSIGSSFSADGMYQLRAYLRWGKKNINSYSPAVPIDANGIFKIKHVVIIMQENRSFDQYFGTYPGADGIPGVAGNPGTVPCEPDPVNGGCVKPFHDTNDKNYGGPHGAANATADMDCTNAATRTGCQMDGFIGQAEKGSNCTTNDPGCSPCTGISKTTCIDVMGYHDGSDMPNYWAYAQNFVLQDQMYEPNASWSLPEHLYQVSEWSAFCSDPNNPFSCRDSVQSPNSPTGQPDYAWTDMTYLLHQYGVSWAY